MSIARHLRVSPLRAAALVTVFAMATTLRFWGLNWGLPDLLHTDEWRVVLRALSFGTGNLHPGSFELGTLGMYLCAMLYAGYAGIGLATGAFQSVEDFAISFFVNPTPFYLIARSLFLLCGLVSIWLVYLIGRELGGYWAGLAAAAALAVLPEHVRYSHTAYPETMMLCLIAAALYAIVRSREQAASYRKDLLAGVSIGFGIATKYVAAFAIPGYVIWRFWEGIRLRMRCKGIGMRLGIAGAACVTAFFAGMPFFFLDLPEAIGAVGRLDRGAQLSHDDDDAVGMAAIAAVSSHDGLGLPAITAGAIGVALLCWRRPAYGVVLGTIVLANLLWALRSERVMVRWLFPAELVLCIGLGCLAAWLYGMLRPRGGPCIAGASALLVVAVILPQPSVTAFHRALALSEPDTRVLSRLWIEKHVPEGSRILVVGVRAYGPQLSADSESVSRWIQRAEHGDDGRFGNVAKYYRYQLRAVPYVDRPKYRLSRMKFRGRPAPEYDLSQTLSHYLDQGVRYVVTDTSSERSYRYESDLVIAEITRFYEELHSSFRPCAVFSRGPGVRGPTITMWCLKGAEGHQMYHTGI